MRSGHGRPRWDEATLTTAVLAVLMLAAAIWGLVDGWDDGSVYALTGVAAVMAILAARSGRGHRR